MTGKINLKLGETSEGNHNKTLETVFGMGATQLALEFFGDDSGMKSDFTNTAVAKHDISERSDSEGDQSEDRETFEPGESTPVGKKRKRREIKSGQFGNFSPVGKLDNSADQTLEDLEIGSSCVTSASGGILDCSTVDDDDIVDDKEPKQFRFDKDGETSVKFGEGLGLGIVGTGELSDGGGKSNASETDMLEGNSDHQEGKVTDLTPVEQKGDGGMFSTSGAAEDDLDLEHLDVDGQ